MEHPSPDEDDEGEPSEHNEEDGDEATTQPGSSSQPERKVNKLRGYLTEQAVRAVFALKPERKGGKAKVSSKELAKKYNVSAKTIRGIWTGQNWNKVTAAIANEPAGGTVGGHATAAESHAQALGSVTGLQSDPGTQDLPFPSAGNSTSPHAAAAAVGSGAQRALPSGGYWHNFGPSQPVGSVQLALPQHIQQGVHGAALSQVPGISLAGEAGLSGNTADPRAALQQLSTAGLLDFIRRHTSPARAQPAPLLPAAPPPPAGGLPVGPSGLPAPTVAGSGHAPPAAFPLAPSRASAVGPAPMQRIPPQPQTVLPSPPLAPVSPPHGVSPAQDAAAAPRAHGPVAGQGGTLGGVHGGWAGAGSLAMATQAQVPGHWQVVGAGQQRGYAAAGPGHAQPAPEHGALTGLEWGFGRGSGMPRGDSAAAWPHVGVGVGGAEAAALALAGPGPGVPLAAPAGVLVSQGVVAPGASTGFGGSGRSPHMAAATSSPSGLEVARRPGAAVGPGWDSGPGGRLGMSPLAAAELGSVAGAMPSVVPDPLTSDGMPGVTLGGYAIGSSWKGEQGPGGGGSGSVGGEQFPRAPPK